MRLHFRASLIDTNDIMIGINCNAWGKIQPADGRLQEALRRRIAPVAYQTEAGARNRSTIWSLTRCWSKISLTSVTVTP